LYGVGLVSNGFGVVGYNILLGVEVNLLLDIYGFSKITQNQIKKFSTFPNWKNYST